MKKIVILLVWIGFSSASLWAMPSQITFQGTLKDKNGVPVNSPPNVDMWFYFFDDSGNPISNAQPYHNPNVQVTNGLFAVSLPIDPSIPWEQYKPYVRVLVNGEKLDPDQPLNANLFAVSAIPQGMIAMFASGCPAGWSEFTALRGRFPIGADPNNPTQFSAGDTGGSATVTTGFGVVFSNTQGPGSFAADWRRAVDPPSPWPGGPPPTVSNLPPYVAVKFCYKI